MIKMNEKTFRNCCNLIFLGYKLKEFPKEDNLLTYINEYGKRKIIKGKKIENLERKELMESNLDFIEIEKENEGKKIEEQILKLICSSDLYECKDDKEKMKLYYKILEEYYSIYKGNQEKSIHQEEAYNKFFKVMNTIKIKNGKKIFVVKKEKQTNIKRMAKTYLKKMLKIKNKLAKFIENETDQIAMEYFSEIIVSKEISDLLLSGSLYVDYDFMEQLCVNRKLLILVKMMMNEYSLLSEIENEK